MLNSAGASIGGDLAAYTIERSDGCTVTGEIVADKVHGVVTVAWPDGTIRSTKIYDMNTPEGTHTTYNEAGEVVEILEYEAGILVAINGEPPPQGGE